MNQPMIHDFGVGSARDSSRRVPDSEPRPESEEIDVTVVIPMRNEEANVAPMCAELQKVMDNELLRYEVIIINDGSDDRTADELEKSVRHDPRFTVVEFYRSFGQSAALSARLRHGARQDHCTNGWRSAKRSS